MMRRFFPLWLFACASAVQAQAVYSNAADAARGHWDTCIAAAKVAGDAKLCAEKLFRETSSEVPDRNPQKLALLKMAQDLFALLSRVGTQSAIHNDQIKLEIMSIEMAYASAARQSKRVVHMDPVVTMPIMVAPEVKISR